METQTLEEIKALYPDQWVLIGIVDGDTTHLPQQGTVLLAGKDYLELCYKASEIAADRLTTLLYTGVPNNQHRKWLKVTRSPEQPTTI